MTGEFMSQQLNCNAMYRLHPETCTHIQIIQAEISTFEILYQTDLKKQGSLIFNKAFFAQNKPSSSNFFSKIPHSMKSILV